MPLLNIQTTKKVFLKTDEYYQKEDKKVAIIDDTRYQNYLLEAGS